MIQRPLKIGNAQGFWGDRTQASAELLRQAPELDYLTLDYLAEVSLSILAGQRARDPSAGYARDFLEVVRSLGPYWNQGGRCRLITNAGGLNPRACAQACRELLDRSGNQRLKIAVVTGDDVLERLRQPRPQDRELLRNADTLEPIDAIADRLVTANAYLGAAPIAAALEAGADLVITGRVADPSLTVGPCMFHFGWPASDYDKIAGATVAGHLIECGTQVTGGISTHWLEMPDPAHLGFPIVEVHPDGSCTVTKPPGTGGRVDEYTVKEQLLYELGDPARYQSPDVTASFLTLEVLPQGADRVHVRGATGGPPPPTYKVSATYRNGYRAQAMLAVYGRGAVVKARRAGEIVLQRVREAGYSLQETQIECLGRGDVVPIPALQRADEQSLECVLRVAVSAPSQDAVEQFTREVMPLITSGPQGVTGYAEGRPRVHAVYGYWPCLVERAEVSTEVELVGDQEERQSRRGTPRETRRE